MMHHLGFSFELKEAGETGLFSGMASTYGNTDRMGDIVMPGAFTATLTKGGDRRPLLWSHKTDEPIGTVMLTDTSAGLRADGTLDLDVQAGRDALSRLRKGIVQGLSIGFRTLRDRVENGARLLEEIELFEVSLVTIPANESARVMAVKSLATIRDYERWLRDEGGFSRAQARALAASGWRGLTDAGRMADESAALADWLRQQIAAA